MISLLLAAGSPALFAGPLEQAKLAMKAGEACLYADQLDSAIAHYRAAEQMLSGLAGERADLFQCRNAIADLLFRKNQFAEAESLALAVRAEAGQVLGEDHIILAVTHQVLGYLCAYQDRLGAAREYYGRALAIRRRHYAGDDPRIADCLYSLGSLELRQGNFTEAEEHLSEAIGILANDRRAESFSLVNCLVLLGNVHDALGQPARAIEDASEALSILKEERKDESASAASCLHALSVYETSLGRMNDALHHERQAYALARRHYGSRHSLVIASLSHLADCLSILGDYEAALQHYHEALDASTAFVGSGHSSTLDVQRRLGHLYKEMGELDSAKACLLRSTAGLERTLGPSHPHLRYSFRQLGDIARKEKRYTVARAHYARALAVSSSAQSRGERPEVVDLLCAMAETFLDEGRSDSAGQVLLRAETGLRTARVTDGPLQSQVLCLQGRTTARQGRYGEALRLYQAALTALVPAFSGTAWSRNPPVPSPGLCRAYLRILTEKGNLLADLPRGFPGSREEALKASLAAYTQGALAVERLRGSYLMENSRLSLQDHATSVFAGAQRVALGLARLTGERTYVHQAFAFSERAKNPVLREMAAGEGIAHDDSLSVRMAGWRKDLMVLERAVEFASYLGDTARAVSLRRELLQRSEQFERLNSGSGQPTMPAPGAAGAPGARLQELQGRLDARTALLEYTVCPPSVIAYCVTRDTVLVSETKRSRELEPRITSLLKGIRTLGKKTYFEAARALSGELILPFRATLSTMTKVVVVADGSLHYIPFEALFLGPVRDAFSQDLDFSRLPYLVSRCAVSYAPAGSMAERRPEAGGRQKQKRSFAGFAPVFDAQTPPLWAAELARRDKGRGELRSVTFDGKRFNDLPGSAVEVRTIAEAFRRAGGEAVSYTGRQATKEQFKETAPAFDIVHIASHGYYNERCPQLSGILFAGNAGDSSTSQSMFFYAGEAYALELNSDLVVLSSCESGGGRLVQGEGVVGLTRGLLLSGARSVMYSLWKVRDQETSAIMQDFYGLLLGGKSHPEALREAKLSLIRNRATAFPLHWASFVVTDQ